MDACFVIRQEEFDSLRRLSKFKGKIKMQRRRFLQSIMGLGVAASVGGFIDSDSSDSPDAVRGRGIVADCIIFDELEFIDKELCPVLRDFQNFKIYLTNRKT